MQAKAVIRHVPEYPRPGMFSPLLTAFSCRYQGKSWSRSFLGRRSLFPSLLRAAPCSKPTDTVRNRLPRGVLALAPHSRSGSILDGCILSLQLEQECLAPLLKLLCFRRAKCSQLLPQLMGAAVRAQHSWKSSLQLHSWE